MTIIAILYLVAKSIASFVFLVLSFVLLYLAIKSKIILEKLMRIEILVKRDIYRLMNAGSLVAGLILPYLFRTRTQQSSNFILKLLRSSPWAKPGDKYAELFSPIANIIEAASELGSKIGQLNQSK